MINFKTVKYKNLLSSGNTFTEIQLDSHQTTLVLGENGSGKSTLLDALCFGLYGRGFRNLKKDLLINSINGRELEVEIEFAIGTKQYRVVRAVKPNKFELYLNDVMINQDASVRDYQEHLEKQILKMSFRSFTQVAILGSANFVPFMQLKTKDRRNLVEDLLDIIEDVNELDQTETLLRTDIDIKGTQIGYDSSTQINTFLTDNVLTLYKTLEDTIRLDLDRSNAYTVLLIQNGKSTQIIINGGSSSTIKITQGD